MAERLRIAIRVPLVKLAHLILLDFEQATFAGLVLVLALPWRIHHSFGWVCQRTHRRKFAVRCTAWDEGGLDTSAALVKQPV